MFGNESVIMVWMVWISDICPDDSKWVRPAHYAIPGYVNTLSVCPHNSLDIVLFSCSVLSMSSSSALLFECNIRHI